FHVSQDKVGLYRYEVQVEPMPGEVTLVNNSATFLLRVVDEPIRVLLLEGKPYWDSKFLTRTLLADPSIELDTVVRLGQGRFLRRKFSRPRPSGKPGEVAPPVADPLKDPATSDSADNKDREEWKILTTTNDVLGKTESLKSYQI